MKKKILYILTLLSGITLLSGSYFSLQYACKRNKKELPPINLSKEYMNWYNEQTLIPLSITSYDHLTLKGLLLKADTETDKVIILVHGYHSNNLRQYIHYLRFFHESGYHILLPDNRAHGLSEGTYIGFGWLDRLDLIQWIYFIKDYFNKELQIALHGISMGGATVLCTSGEQLPKDVKCIIEDCGYASLYSQLKHIAKNSNKQLKPFLLSSALLSRKIIGYSIFDASPIKQIKKTHLPILFIHGDKDTYVPTSNVYKLFKACPSRKELCIIKDAKHAKCYDTDSLTYKKRVTQFLNQYID